MRINSAALSELSVVKNICEATISAIYPKYYPAGAVHYFLELHSENNILKDIGEGCVYLYKDALEIPVGTVTVKGNEVCRLFVLPAYQGKGYGSQLLDFAENIILRHYSNVAVAASFPAKCIYLKRGYADTDFKRIQTYNGDFLCHDVMKKHTV